jgi:trans-aconitate methyltransferase
METVLGHGSSTNNLIHRYGSSRGHDADSQLGMAAATNRWISDNQFVKTNATSRMTTSEKE